MDRWILLVFLATILAISHVSRCLLISVYHWLVSLSTPPSHSRCCYLACEAADVLVYPDCAHQCPACHWPAAVASILDFSNGVEGGGAWRHLHSTLAAWGGCGQLLIGYRQHLIARHHCHWELDVLLDHSPTKFGLSNDSHENGWSIGALAVFIVM